MKLTNKDKQAIRRALFLQVDNVIMTKEDEYSGMSELDHLTNEAVSDYLYKIIGLYPA